MLGAFSFCGRSPLLKQNLANPPNDPMAGRLRNDWIGELGFYQLAELEFRGDRRRAAKKASSAGRKCYNL